MARLPAAPRVVQGKSLPRQAVNSCGSTTKGIPVVTRFPDLPQPQGPDIRDTPEGSCQGAEQLWLCKVCWGCPLKMGLPENFSPEGRKQKRSAQQKVLAAVLVNVKNAAKVRIPGTVWNGVQNLF